MAFELRNKKCVILSRELMFELKLLELAVLSPAFPDFQTKSGGNWSILPKNSIIYLIIFFSNKTHSDSDRFLTLFHVKLSDFENNQ